MRSSFENFQCNPSVIPGEVHMPSGKTAAPEIVDNKDGTVTVRYAPVEVGLHEMHIKYIGNHIPGECKLITLNIVGTTQL